MRRILLAGIASVGLAGLAGSAMAKSPEVHVLTVQLPGGGVEQIRYTGDVPPAIVIAPGPAPDIGFAPMPPLFGPNSPFAVMDRISAEMDRETANLISQVESIAAAAMPGPGPRTEAAFGRPPPGASGFSFISTMNANGVCTESMQVTYSGNGTPKVVSSHSGDCGAAGGAATPAVLPAPGATPAPAPGRHPVTILANASDAHPDTSIVRKADWQH
jgi:hypothetical protein